MKKLRFFKPRISTSSAFGVFVRRTLEVVLRGKHKLVKPKFFLGMPLALISLELYSGALLGYFAAKLLSGRLNSPIFNIGNYKLHLHHWLYGLGFLISAIWYQFLPFPQFSFGFLGGVVFQGISCYPDWHRVLVRRKG